jgi:hypothetical protein
MQPTHPHPVQTKKSPYKMPLVLLALCVIVLAWIGWMIISQLHQQHIMKDRYQAVYLSSGKIYFGKLQNTGGDYLTLTQAFTTQDLTAPATQNSKQQIQQTQTAITKLSQQVYGPDDTIALSSKQVLFWQNLRDDSKVVQAIKSAQK